MENDLKEKINYYIKMFTLFLFIVLFLYVLYDNDVSKNQIRQSTKKSDSLEALIQKYQYDYIDLKKRADVLDSIIKVRKDSILIVKERFYIYKNKEIKNPDEATKYIINFLKE